MNGASSPQTSVFEPTLDPQAVFLKRFGDLVTLLRVDPGNDAAQDLALTAAASAVEHHAIVVESGFEHGVEEDLSLAGRLRARGVELIRIAAGAGPEELLQLARALSHDATPVRNSPRIRVEMTNTIIPGTLAATEFSPPRGSSDRRSWGERRQWRPEPGAVGSEQRFGADRRTTGERRLKLRKQHEAEVFRLRERLDQSIREESWGEALDRAHTLFQQAARVPAMDRRSFMLGVRQHLPRAALAAFIDRALTEPAEQGRAVDVLRWCGLEGADAMVEAIRGSETVGPRHFLHQALGEMPEAFVSVVPLLNGTVHEAIHAARVLGEMGRREAVKPLRERLYHEDARVRRAVLLALASMPLTDVIDAFSGALGHASADTRAAAAEAIGRAGAASMAMPLVAALGVERDAVAWTAMIRALGALRSPEACAALAAVALAQRRLLSGGYPLSRRIEAVRVLGNLAAPCRQPALQRIAREGDEPVRQAAEAALQSTKS